MSPKAINRHITKALLPLGFKELKSKWSRNSGSFEDVVHLQLSNDGERFTINLGVCNLIAYELYFGQKAPAALHETDCTVRARIGELLTGVDAWWSMSNGSCPDEAISALSNQAMAFFESLHTANAILTRLGVESSRHKGHPLPEIYRAIFRHRLGQHEEANRTLEGLAAKAPKAWGQKIFEVQERLRALGPSRG